MAMSSFVRVRSSLRLVFGIVCVAVGIALMLRPFTSLSVLVVLVAAALAATGVATLATLPTDRSRGAAVVAGVAWIAGGIAALAWPDITVRGVALIVGIAMVVHGLADVAAGVRGASGNRLAAMARGLASVVLGVLALTWPDVTVLVVAIVFGARTVTFGLAQMAVALRPRRVPSDPDPDPDLEPEAGDTATPATPRRGLRAAAGPVAGLVLAVALAGLSAQLHRSNAVVDAFYDTPTDVPAEPGHLLRSEPFDRGIPDGAHAWRILYTTTRDEGIPAIASGIVVAPAAAASAPRPVIAWAHGTTGVARACAPSVLDDPFGSGAFFALDRVIDQGWVLVATDYIGLGTSGPHPYLVGQAEARSVLDAVRAAKQLEPLDLAEQTVVWGHSQGGHAALWTGALASAYAPDVHVKGVAALAPASDPLGLVGNLATMPGGSLFAAFVMVPYSEVYPDVRLTDYLRPGGDVVFERMASRCLTSSEMIVSLLSSLTTNWSIFERDPSTGAARRRLVENTPTDHIDAPLLIAQGLADPLILPEVQAAYVAARCADGQAVDYRTYDGRDHVGLVDADSPLLPDLVAWTRDRLAGVPAIDTCPHR